MQPERFNSHSDGLADAGPPCSTDPPTPREPLRHPYIVLRIAGLPSSMVQRLSTGFSRHLLDRVQKVKESAAPLIQDACDVLEYGVGLKSVDQNLRHIFLRARRNLFNYRLSGLAKQDNILDIFDASGASTVRQADALVAEFLDLQMEYSVAFKAECQEASHRLHKLCMEDKEFLKGVAFSSSSLVADYMTATADPGKYTGKRKRQLDIALFNYFIRASTKVSPLTYFTPVLPALWSGHAKTVLALNNRSVVSSVEASRRALSHLIAHLSRSLKFWGDSHPLVLNSTVKRDGDVICFRELWSEGANNGRTWGVHQSLVRLPANPRVLNLVKLFQESSSKAQRSLREIVVTYKQDYAGSISTTGVIGLVAGAVQVGLLLPVLNLYDQEDWMCYLANLLEERQKEALPSLKALNQSLASYSQASFEDRVAYSKAANTAFEELCDKVGASPFKDRKTPLFHEDCYFDGDTPSVPSNHLGDTVKDMARLSEVFPLLDFNHLAQSVTGAILCSLSGGRRLVPANEVLGAIASEAEALSIRMTSLPLQKQDEELSSYCTNAAQLLRGKTRLLQALWKRMELGDPVMLNDAFIDSFAEQIPEEVRRRSTSYTVIGQSSGRAPGEQFVLNRLYSGRSMLMSRFMRGQSPERVRRVSRYLDQLAQGAKVTEIPGVFGFNANLHPCFADRELAIDGRLSNYRNTNKLSLSKLFMRYDEHLDKIIFVSPEGQDLSLHYFGFLNLMILPNIHQLLGRTDLQGLILDLWRELYFAGFIPQNRTSVIPRVTYGNTVISRRSQFIPSGILPSPSLSDADFFRAFHILLHGMGESSHLYVRLIATRNDFIPGDGEAPSNIGAGTDFKPAYLNLDVPLSLNSLKRRLLRRRRSILIQEALPALGTGEIEINGSTRACEYQFEVSLTGDR